MKKCIYEKVENGIEYLVFQANNYSYMNKYRDKNKMPWRYRKYKNTKYLIYSYYTLEEYYFYDNLNHNLYDFAHRRYYYDEFNDKWFPIINEYYIYGEKYKFEDWNNLRNRILRIKKIDNLNRIADKL